MRKLLKPLLFAIVIFCIGFGYYSKTYPIKNDMQVIKDRIIKFINRPTPYINDIDIKQELNLDNKKYIFFLINDQFNDQLGGAELTKGINNKYKIESTEWASGSLRDEIVKTNKGKYLILKGKNLDNRISYVKISLDNKEYTINIPQKEYYMVYCSVPLETEETFLDFNSIKFYDNNNTDITLDVF